MVINKISICPSPKKRQNFSLQGSRILGKVLNRISVVIMTKKVYFDNKDIIRRFVEENEAQIIVAVHIDLERDLKIISKLEKSQSRFKFIIVPYRISAERLDKIKYELSRKTLLFSECDELTDFHDTQNLVIDFNGAVPDIVTYGTTAYIGSLAYAPEIENLAKKAGIPCYNASHKKLLK